MEHINVTHTPHAWKGLAVTLVNVTLDLRVMDSTVQVYNMTFKHFPLCIHETSKIKKQLYVIFYQFNLSIPLLSFVSVSKTLI